MSATDRKPRIDESTSSIVSRGDDAERLTAAERRESLLDVAKLQVTADGPDAITMGTVADAANVTRALVYKHFENRDELLVALYRREASSLDREIREVVVAADPGLESKLRALVGMMIDTADRYGPFFRLLRRMSVSDSARSDRRGWDRRTVKYFAGLVQDETEIDERTALTATSLLLTPLQTLRTQALADPRNRDHYIDTYIEMVLGALARLDPANRPEGRVSLRG